VSSRIGIFLVAVAATLSAMYALLWNWVDLVRAVEPSFPLVGWFGGVAALRAVTDPAPAFAVLGALLYTFVRFWLWWKARGGNGAIFLLVAAIVGALPLLAQMWVLASSHVTLVPQAAIPAFAHLQRAAREWGWLIQPLSLLLLGIGLLRSRMVGTWVALLAFVAASLLAIATAGAPVSALPIPGMGSLNSTGDGYVYAAVAEFAFLLALGISLARAELSGRPVAATSNNGIERTAQAPYHAKSA
jgi:hypothetical protein